MTIHRSESPALYAFLLCFAVLFLAGCQTTSPKSVQPVEPLNPLTSHFASEPRPSKGPEHAPVTLVEFADFHCIHCRRIAPRIQRLYEEFPGKIRWVFHPFPLFGSPGQGSYLTHEASLCAEEAGRFWEFHDRALALAGGPTEEKIIKAATEAEIETDFMTACLQEARHRDQLGTLRKEASDKGVRATPTISINGEVYRGAKSYEALKEIVEAVIDGHEPPAPDGLSSPRPETVKRVSIESVATLDGHPSRGPEDAEMVIVEFGDFHCPYCQKSARVLDAVQKEFGEKVRHVFFHFPLSIHSTAMQTHIASACAHRQQKFWEFRDSLFSRPSAPRSRKAVLQTARDAGLTMKDFIQCLDSGEDRVKIFEDRAAGERLGIRGTPSFLLNGNLLRGYLPYPVFRERVLQWMKSEKTE